jgi:hypothetical protein
VLCCAVLCCAVLQLRCEYDVKGQLVFRGPRLRIGVCEGVPRTVMPDHLGRCVINHQMLVGLTLNPEHDGLGVRPQTLHC